MLKLFDNFYLSVGKVFTYTIRVNNAVNVCLCRQINWLKNK